MRSLLGRVLVRGLYLFVLSVVLFYAVHAMPGGARGAYLALHPDLSSEEVERLLTIEGFDRPIAARYRCWWLGRTAAGCGYWPGGGVLRGDFGYSRLDGRSVGGLLAERWPRTLTLMVPAMMLALLSATGFGFWSARRAGRWPDRLVSIATFGAQATPLHVAAAFAIVVGALYGGFFPPGGAGPVEPSSSLSHIRYAVLPILCLAGYFGAIWTRYLRLELLVVAGRSYVTAARAKGLSEGQVWLRHILPNALTPMLTSVVLAIPSVFSGALVIESVFSYPGIGLLMFDSVRLQDHLTAMVAFLMYAAAAMVATTVGDGLVRWLHPAIGARASE